MRDKGYAFPLYSLDLLRPGEAPPEGAQYVLLAPEGRLVTRPALRRRGADTPTALVRQALRRGLAHHAVLSAHLAACGLDGAWADGMRHWAARLEEEERRSLAREGALALSRAEQRGSIERARQLRTRIQLAARLGDLPDLGRGRAPRAELDLLDDLRQLAAKAEGQAAALSACGFPQDEREELAGLARELPRSRDALLAGAEALRAGRAAIAVLRGALLGDLSRLSAAAPQVLAPEQAAHLQQRALLG